jgi:hypothetical protein
MNRTCRRHANRSDEGRPFPDGGYKNSVTSASNEESLAGVLPVVRAILRRKTGMSLAEDDARRDNVDAIELYHDALTRIWDRLRSDTASIADLKAYAATVTHNVWSEYLRQKYPKRASLKNRLRYFLTHQPRYGVWESPEGELVAGFRKWQLAGTLLATGKLTGMRDGTQKLPPGSLPPRGFEQWNAQDWDRLLDALFVKAGAPASVDDLVGAVAELVGLKEERFESLDEEDDDASEFEPAASDDDLPDRRAEIRSSLRELWTAICRLKDDYRCAYLLNIPGPGKSRGDIEVFPLHGIATIAQIAAVLSLNERQYQTAWDLLELGDDDLKDLARLSTAEDKFCLLWKHLPLADTTIGRLLGLDRQQVINRRMLATRELARAITGGRPVKIRASR